MAFEKSLGEDTQFLLPPEDVTQHQPLWFREALATPHEECWLTVDGCPIHYLRWGDRDPARPGVLFVHGNGAHAHWFSFIAPLLLPEFNVAAMELSGMGDSHWRTSVTRDSFAHEIGQVALNAGLGPKPVVCGHSFGGFVSLIAGKHYSDRFGGMIFADFRVRPPEDHMEWFLNDPPRKPTRLYPDFESCAARFRLAPPQPCANQFILDHIGPLSIREVKRGENEGRAPSEEAGWTWKFNPMIFEGLRMGDDHAEIYRSLKCPAATMFGAHSKDYTPDQLTFLRELAPRHAAFTIAGAQHHIMLDQPHAFAAAVAALMAKWQADGALG